MPTPAQPGIITGSSVVCNGQTEIYSVAPVENATTYNWTLPSGGSWVKTAGGVTNSITVTAGTTAGDVSVKASNCNSVESTTARTLAVTPIPVQPSEITGFNMVCSGQSLSYSVTAEPDIIYQWQVPSGWNITAGQGTNSITVTTTSTTDNITVTPSRCSVSGTARTMTTYSAPTPSIMTIQGNTTVCPQSTHTYSVADEPNLTYAWTVPSGWAIKSGQGSHSITVVAGTGNGNIGVTPANCSNLTASASTLTVTVSSTAAGQPGSITRMSNTGTNVCSNQSATFSVANTANVSYDWSVPAGWTITSGQGSNTITALSGTGSGTVSVTAAQCNGTPSSARTLSVNAPSSCTTYTFDYTGGEQSVTLAAGTYTLHVYGAQGGIASGTSGGSGGYATGTITLTNPTTVYVVVGGQGNTIITWYYKSLAGGYNGGGIGWDMGTCHGGSGGGATHISRSSGLLTDPTVRSNIYIAAGGGGGASSYGGGQGGGGMTGNSHGNSQGGQGGTQTAGGAPSASRDNRVQPTAGSAGQGGDGGLTRPNGGYGSAGGGGGWFGGGGTGACGDNDNTAYGGGGGSGYTGRAGVTNASMQNNNRSGNGYAKITRQ
jgi:uncharacterized protein YbdZ (MbtH family)